ncbi:MAG: hypothetical protein WCT04_07935 [Planctomycetota bacterium]
MPRITFTPQAPCIVYVYAYCVFAAVTTRSFAADENKLWPAAVEDWKAPAPGEHPRLFFRKNDLPELKKRAASPEGQIILKRLREQLDGKNGDTFPTVFNASGHAYQGNAPGKEGDANKDNGKSNSTSAVGKSVEMPVGAYTVGHAAGYGLLYQLTGEKKYADLGRKCFEKAFEGVRDRDDRYSWKTPGGALRCGPSIGAYALGYDLCFNGWDPEFQKQVAQAFMKYDEGPNTSLESCALGKRQHPGSNHWGAEIGGPALVLLAIKGDPGADNQKVDELLAGNEKCFLRQLNEGWGDHGFFAEGDGPGTISSDTSFIPGLRAWKIGGGKDFITPRPNAQWMTLKWVMLTLPGKAATKDSFPHRGVYDHDVFSRTGMSGSGTFAQGFAAIAEEYKPALLWTYNHCVSSGKPEYDGINIYPHRSVYAFVNWPLGLEEKNPADVLPRAVEDKKMAFYMFRNRWQDENDIIVTALLKGAKGNYSVPGGDIIVWGLGKKTTFPVKVTGAATAFSATKTGGTFSTGAGAFGVDFSGASGADALLVFVGATTGKAGKGQVINAGKNTFTIMTLQKGNAPEAKADGDNLVLGGQTVLYDGKTLSFGK